MVKCLSFLLLCYFVSLTAYSYGLSSYFTDCAIRIQGKQVPKGGFDQVSGQEDKFSELEHPFLKAAKLGDFHALRKYVLAHEGEEFIEIREVETGFSALHYAAAEDHAECVYYLLQIGFPLNLEDKSKRTPMDVAPTNSYSLRLLVESTVEG